MPEIRIRYDDDSDRMPYEAIAEIVRAAGKHLQVNELEWVRDDDLPEKAATTPPDAPIDAAVLGDIFRPYRGWGA